MASVGDALKAGDVAGALAAATAAVKAAPTDADARWLFAEMLLIANDPERADKMLDAATVREPNVAVLEFRKLLRAELLRRQAFFEGRPPRYQGEDATPAQRAATKARMLMRLGDVPGAQAAAAEVEELRPRAPGEAALADGATLAFDDLRDADDILAAEFEILTTAGDYMLVPVERVRSLEIDAPRRARDLVWRRCAIDLKDGTEGVVYMPALYLGPASEQDPTILLGRSTEWSDPAEGPVRGRGQRLFLAGDEAVSATALAKLVFA